MLWYTKNDLEKILKTSIWVSNACKQPDILFFPKKKKCMTLFLLCQGSSLENHCSDFLINYNKKRLVTFSFHTRRAYKGWTVDRKQFVFVMKC